MPVAVRAPRSSGDSRPHAQSPRLSGVAGTAGGFIAAFGFPSGFEEALKFILPGYFAGLLVVEMKGWAMALVCLGSLAAALPGVLASPGWGWLVTAIVIATFGWSLEQWKLRA